MLERLQISNYALIDHLDINFTRGLNIITGETGAGKSIILGAIGLLLGGRADQRVITDPEQKTVVEGAFMINDNQMVADFCAANDIDTALSPLIIRRELSAGGRSRAFINDTPVTITKVQELGLLLIDIHSQHQNQLLSQPAFQLRVIDSLAANADLLADYRKHFDAFRRDLIAYRHTRDAIEADRANADFIEFQLQQLDKLDLSPGELCSLEASVDELQTLADNRRSISEAQRLLSSADGSILDMLSSLRDVCGDIEPLFSPDDKITERLHYCIAELSDIAGSVDSLADSIGSDASELVYTRRRISAIRSAISKAGVADEEALIAHLDTLRSKMARMEEAPALLESLEKKARASKAEAIAAAKLLTASRREAAARFAADLLATASPLGMRNLQVDIKVSPAKLSVNGADEVTFLFAFNKNQAPTQVANAASGGEISRVMLSVKSIVADRIALPTVIFDEIDTGVSGDVAARIGAMLCTMGSGIQVIAITHLPQVAAMGDTHIKVFKVDDAHTTHTRMALLSDAERVGEIAEMLSGNADDAAAIANAKSLFAKNPTFKS